MPDDPVRVVVDCSIPDREAAIAYTQDQVEAVLNLRVYGGLSSEEAAKKLVELAERAVEAAGIPDRVTVVPLSGDDLAQHARDQETAAADAKAQADDQAEHDALIERLKSGKASPDEVQAALGALLGGKDA